VRVVVTTHRAAVPKFTAAWLNWAMTGRPLQLLAVVLVTGLLAGCQGQVSVDLTTDPAADPNLSEVVAQVLGLEFARDDGTTETLEFTASEAVNFLDYQNGILLNLFTDEELPTGTYTGVRLLFDTDENGRFVTDDLGRQFPLLLATGNYADFDLTVEDRRSSSESLTLTLDLRQSLYFTVRNGEYTLQPYLRSVPTDDASILEGTVAISCPAGTSLLEGGAVYLFRGQDVEPDDRDGNGVEPYATTSLILNSLTAQFGYRLLDVPPGDYTIAATCRGNREDPTIDTLMTFRGTRNVEVDSDEVIAVNVSD
jgi:Domain of unknown function (DUF4382)